MLGVPLYALPNCLAMRFSSKNGHRHTVYTLGGHLGTSRGRRRWRGETTVENRNVASGDLTSMDGR